MTTHCKRYRAVIRRVPRYYAACYAQASRPGGSPSASRLPRIPLLLREAGCRVLAAL